MRPILIFASVAFLAGAAAQHSLAQPPAEGHDASASQTLNPTMANGAPPVPEQAQTGEAKPASATAASVMPKTWTGNPQQWDAHAKACAKRYRNYDPATDTYRGLFRTQTCRISPAPKS